MGRSLHETKNRTHTNKTAVNVDPHSGDASHHIEPLHYSRTSKPVFKLPYLLGITIAIVIVSGAFAVYHVVDQATAGTEIHAEKSAKRDLSARFENAGQIIDELPNLQGSSLAVATVNETGGRTDDQLNVYTTPYLTVGNRSYSNLPTSHVGKGYVGSEQATAKDYTAVVNFFEKNYFAKAQPQQQAAWSSKYNGSSVRYISFATYESERSLCLVQHTDASATPLEAHIVSVGCADKSSYEAAAKVLDPFYSAYAKAKSPKSGTVVLGIPIPDSRDLSDREAMVYHFDPRQNNAVPFKATYTQEPGKNNWLLTQNIATAN